MERRVKLVYVRPEEILNLFNLNKDIDGLDGIRIPTLNAGVDLRERSLQRSKLQVGTVRTKSTQRFGEAYELVGKDRSS